MEELLLLVIGASALALSPVVPLLRPVAKTAVKGGLAVADGAKAAVVVAGHQVDKVRSRSRSDGEAVAAEATAVEAPAATVAGDAASVEATTDTTQAETAPATWPMDDTPTPGLIDIDGIGPKVVGVLEAAGITTLEQLAMMDETQLREILASAGPRYRLLNPSSWPEQARRLVG